MMYRRIGFLLLLFAQVGCFAPVTRRIDFTNQQMVEMRGELTTANSNLAETRVSMQRMEKYLEQAARQLEETNKRLKPLERFAKPFGIDANAGPITEAMCWEGQFNK